jgi:glycosyltransferase involved in cell wall biosynthesis
MSDQPIVSVIVIFLNAEKFIGEAIESIYAQSYQNWELLLVDDGTTDGSTAIALRYAERSPEKVRYLEHDNHQNRGMSATRNLGIRHARGRYIALLDADDVWLPRKLEEQVPLLNAHPEAGMVYGASQYWHSWRASPDGSQHDYVRRLGVQPDTLIRPPTLLTLSLKSRAPTPCPSDVLLRREIIEEVGGFEETFRGLYEDRAFFSKVYLRAPVFVAGQCWDRYRQHEASSSSAAKKTSQRHDARLFYLRWLETYLSKQGVNDTAVWQALRRKCWRHHHPALYRLVEGIQGMRRMTQTARLVARRTLPALFYRWFRSH